MLISKLLTISIDTNYLQRYTLNSAARQEGKIGDKYPIGKAI